MRLAAHGIAAELPRGWEGSIAAEDVDSVVRSAQAFAETDTLPPLVLPVAHFATCALPAVRSDFGAEIVETMGTADVFVSLLEYDPEDAAAPLFAQQGLPRRLDARWFSPRNLQRTLRGQAGLQVFCNEGGRAFCLYIVIGDAQDAHLLARRAEQVLANLQIDAR